MNAQNFNAAVVDLSTQSAPMGTLSTELSFLPGAAGVTEAIIRPESIVAVPSYILRFVPFVGSPAVLVAIALRQAFYRANHASNSLASYPLEGDAVSVDVSALLRSLGNVISRAKFFRLFKDSRLDWFVTRSEPEHVILDGRIQRQPNTYRYRGLLLTPGDASDLLAWLQKYSIKDHPIETLSEALHTSREQILQFPFRTPFSGTVTFNHALSTHQVVCQALDRDCLDPVLSSLCDSLAAHLVRPESFLAIPWYWFKKVLPELGDDMGALYLMSKLCCYVDWEKGQDRNTFWVPGGLTTLQGWIGSTSLPGRIPQKKVSERGRPRSQDIKGNSEYVRSWREERRSLAGLYLCRIDTRHSDSGSDWQLEVYDTQLTESDAHLRDAVAEIASGSSAVDIHLLGSALHERKIQNLLYRAAFVGKEKGFCHFETLVGRGICHFETLTPSEICHFDTLVDGLNCHFETQLSEGNCHFDTILNILIRLKDTYFNPKYTFPPHTDDDQAGYMTLERPKQVVEGYFDDHGWQPEQIFKRLNPELSRRLISSCQKESLVSWLIYACLTPVIHSPLSFAVTRALETRTNAGGSALRLARLDPGVLAQQVSDTLDRMNSGYLGAGAYPDLLDPDMRAFLAAVPGLSERQQLLQRLVDHLGIRG